MQRIYSYILVALLLLSSNAWARIWYIKPDGTGQAINIQAGIDSSGSGDTVLVAPGIYRGDGNRDLDFKGKPIVVLAECRRNKAITDSTVIDCEGNRHRGFYFHSGETDASILEGFVITNGGSSDFFGGGIACDSTSSPIIRYNRMKNCNASRGGGIYCSGFSAPIISNNEIYQCNAQEGSAICCSDSSAPVISNNEIYANISGYSGAIVCVSSSPVIINNSIHDNDSSWYGDSKGRTSSFRPLATMSGKKIYRNWRRESGDRTTDNFLVWDRNSGGIICSSCPSVTITGNRIYKNWGHDSGAISIDSSSALITNNEIWRNGAQVTSGIQVISSSVTIVGNDIHENIGPCAALACYSGSSATIGSNCVRGNGLGTINNLSPGIEISDCRAVISDNQVTSNIGGGVWYSGDSSGSIENNTITDNGIDDQDSYACGGILCDAPINIIGNTVKNNKGKSGWGGGITCSSSAFIENNIIAKNSSCSFIGRGGGIICDGPAPLLINNTIVGNAAARGSGIFISAQSHPTLSDNIISDNRIYGCQGCPPFEGGGVVSESSSISMSCCDVYSNEGGNYIGMPDQTGVNSNISEDPLFCPEGYPEFTLHSDSPCSPYMSHGCGLIGANPVTCAQTGSDGFNKLISANRLNQNYPNPFNPGTRIAFDLKEPSAVSLRIYDANGRLVRNLIEEKRESGRHEIAWDGKDDSKREVASGVYFYRLTAGSFSETKKMVMLK